ncbi:MAG: PD-(D/E)XK nuclease family protein [Cyclobacteriaceae bacterium]|nr:PD-(D/E)XK nuclease family protein [Cyclobacteriaceae bacterium]
MESFLRELAVQLNKENPLWDSVTLVFPNRRAALYFRKHLSEIITQPLFAPNLLTIEDFISEMAKARVPDKLELVHRLHASYQQIINAADARSEPFDQFYFWGDMLLRDFDEADKYLVNAEQLFKDLRNQKELDSSFDYLTDEQRKFLQEFWSSFDETLNENKKKFIEVWVKLFELYKTFRAQLETEGLAYEGMLHRAVAEEIKIGTLKRNPTELKFVGFNALTKAEEKILEHFVSLGSQMYWDADDYYVNNDRQEAGRFIREYQQHPILRDTLTDGFPSNFRKPKSVKLFSSPQPVGQTKLMAQIIDAELKKGMVPEDTLIVLPDEKLLMPVLHGIAGSVEKLNVTMGFSLSNTPLFNLIELLVELQIARREDYFNHRQVLALLGHPYMVAAGAPEANAKRKEILAHNWVRIPESFLATAVPVHRLMFKKSSHIPLTYLSDIIAEIGSLESLTDFDREYAMQFLKLLNRMGTVVGNQQSDEVVTTKENNKSLKSFLRLLKQLVRAEKIPFTGEPLKGLQVMGVLETRNLDFKNVVILSLNEGAFPAFGNKGSYIPYNIRKAYGMPTIEHQDAMYAYLFYRVLQRAENIFLFYNSETDVLGQGEMSRYLQQLIYESGLTLERFALHNAIQPKTINPITIQKDEKILNLLANLNVGNRYFRGISPSALNTYLECRLKFYFNYIARIKEAREVEEDLDARVLGDFFHKVMERFYKQLAEKKRNNLVELGDFDNYEVVFGKLIDQVFSEAYHLEPGKKVIYEGQGLIVREVIWEFIRRIIKLDIKRVPFVMEAVELSGLLYNAKIKHAPGFVVLGGTIDRVDRKGDEVRIIDYKTGQDKLDFEDIPSLFLRDEKNRKAAFQTLVYALLYKNNRAVSAADAKIVPGLINRENLFNDSIKFGLTMGKQWVGDANGLLPEFEIHLKELLEEIFDPAQVFDQTPFMEKCRYCPYQNICYR